MTFGAERQWHLDPSLSHADSWWILSVSFQMNDAHVWVIIVDNWISKAIDAARNIVRPRQKGVSHDGQWSGLV